MNKAKQLKCGAVYSTAEIREIEHLASTLPDAPRLMEAAGLAAAEVARDRLLTHGGNKVLVLAGPGNNGGDAFVVARHLAGWRFEVTLVFAGERENLSADARQALNAWSVSGGEILDEVPGERTWSAVIDGLFGIGLDRREGRELTGKYLALVERVNAMMLPVLALDIPSGLGSDTGTVRGAGIKAGLTVTFIGLKPGLFTHQGPDYCGEIILRDLGLDIPSLKEPVAWRVDQPCVQELLPPPRPAESHKGMFGSIGIIGGSRGMAGAGLLAGTAALKLGAGRVYLGLLDSHVLEVDPSQPELMLRPVDELFKLKQLSCLVVGPGLGTEPAASFWLGCALESDLPLVLDADALNLAATHPRLAEQIQWRKASSILTPHPAEAARLLRTDTAAIQNDRMTAATELAKRYNCCVVLKGAGSISATPGGKRYINTSGNPGLSSAGTGDILSGMIGAFIAQGSSAIDSLLVAVHLHGAAADALEKELGGPMGMTASEIPSAARRLLNHWRYGSST